MQKVVFTQLTTVELAGLIRDELKPELESLKKRVNDDSKESKEFLSRKETADFFGVTLVCIHQWCNKEIIKPYKVGNRTYFKYSELKETLLNSNRASL